MAGTIGWAFGKCGRAQTFSCLAVGRCGWVSSGEISSTPSLEGCKPGPISISLSVDLGSSLRCVLLEAFRAHALLGG